MIDLTAEYESAAKLMAVLDPDGEEDWEDHFPEDAEEIEVDGQKCTLYWLPSGSWEVWMKGRGTILSGGWWETHEETIEEMIRRRLDPAAYLDHLEKEGYYKYAVVSANDEFGVTWVYAGATTSDNAAAQRRNKDSGDPFAEVISLPSRRLLSKV